MKRIVFAASIFLIACVPAAPTTSAQAALAEGSADAVGVLGFLNGPAATVTVLDVNVGLDKRAAANIVAHIDGADGQRGTADDNPLDTVAELDAISYVGASALAKLQAYVEENGLVPQLVEGVPLTAAQETAILTVANQATETQLDADAGLDSRAATNIVAARPLASIAALAAVKYVGASALEHLRDYAPRFVPAGCYLALADTINQDAADLNQLLVLATTIDAPAFEVLTVHVTGCPGALDAGNYAKLVAAIEARVNWRMSGTLPFHDGGLGAGDADFVSELGGADDAITSRVTDGTWSPSSSPTGAALYARLPSLLSALTPAAASGESELSIILEADECSQGAYAVINAGTLEIRIVHRLSEC